MENSMQRTFQKNDIVQVRIEDVGNSGEGIGKAEGYTLFVKNAVLGDLLEAKIIKAKKNYGYGRIEKILEPSANRVEPVCPIAGQCGGCQMQFLSYEAQLEYKQNKVRNDLIRIGGFDEGLIRKLMDPIIGMDKPFRYRNKAQFPIGYALDSNRESRNMQPDHTEIKKSTGRQEKKSWSEFGRKADVALIKSGDRGTKVPVAGFYATHSHRIIPCDDCHLGIAENKEILDKILEWMQENHVSAYDEVRGKGTLRHVLIRYGFHSKELILCLVVNKKKVPAAAQLVEKLKIIQNSGYILKGITYSVNTEKTNVILGDNMQVLWGQGYITDEIDGIQFQISPLSFYQVNPAQTEKLYGKALEFAGLTGKEIVWDMYCGIGTISLFLAQKARKVYGVEIVPAAIEDAKRNAALNGITNAEFFVGKAEDAAAKLFAEEDARADVVVVDPPRKGCDQALLDTILKMAPEKVVYVSCDPATLARDLKILCAKDYALKKVQAVDQFPQTTHVETVCSLHRIEKKNM